MLPQHPLPESFLRSRSQPLSFKCARRRLAWVAAIWLWAEIAAVGQLPGINAGPDSAFAQVDFAQIYLETENRRLKNIEQLKAHDKELVESGAVSALDLDAPNGAIEEFNRARTLLKAQNSKEAIKHLQKAVTEYPKFVSAHVGLGLAYVDQEDPGRAKSEFEVAAKLDAKYPGSFLHLGRLALSQNDFPAAESALEKAAALHPKDVDILSVLAYAENGTRQYRSTLRNSSTSACARPQRNGECALRGCVRRHVFERFRYHGARTEILSERGPYQCFSLQSRARIWLPLSTIRLFSRHAPAIHCRQQRYPSRRPNKLFPTLTG